MRMFAFRMILVIALFLGIIAAFSIILGDTAGFNRTWSLSGRFLFYFVGTPLILLSLICLFWIFMKFIPKTMFQYIFSFIIIGILLILSPIVISKINLYGWIIDVVTSDSLRITDDGFFEYRIEIVNQFQRNSSLKIFINDMNLNKDISILLDIYPDKVSSIVFRDYNQNFLWGRMYFKEELNKYILEIPVYTNSDYIYINNSLFYIDRLHSFTENIFFSGSFMIDMENQISSKIN